LADKSSTGPHQHDEHSKDSETERVLPGSESIEGPQARMVAAVVRNQSATHARTPPPVVPNRQNIETIYSPPPILDRA